MARVNSLRSSLDSSLIFRLFYVNCRDAEGNFYFDPVFNETVQIVEFDEGFDTEVFFMWVFIVAGALLVLFLGFTMLSGELPSLIKIVFGPSMSIHQHQIEQEQLNKTIEQKTD